MSYQPYVQQAQNNNKQATGNSAYGPPNGSTGANTTNSFNSSVYGNNTTYASTPSSSVYAPLKTTNASTVNNPYGPRPTAPVVQQSYPGTSTSVSSTPPFSQALDLPPPSQPAVTNTGASGYSYSSSPKRRGENDYTGGMATATAYPVATAQNIPGAMPTTSGMSLTNSKIYQGGPTNGLVSEGNPVQCHKVDYEIKGHEMQLVEIELDPNETVIGEAGAMMFIEDSIKFEAKFGDGSNPKQGFWKKLLAAGGRLMTGESLFVTHFTNEGQRKARVAFAAPYPGNIVPLNLADLGGSITCQRDAFLCAALGTKISMTFNKKIGSGLFGGEGFILQKMKGDGMAFVHAGGTIIKRELRGERIRLDTGCLVAFTEGVTFDIMFVPGLKTMFFGGEGLFLAVLQGTGTVWMQSLPFSRMADRIIQSAPSAGGRRVGEGSMLTGRMGDVVNGDGFGFRF